MKQPIRSEYLRFAIYLLATDCYDIARLFLKQPPFLKQELNSYSSVVGILFCPSEICIFNVQSTLLDMRGRLQDLLEFCSVQSERLNWVNSVIRNMTQLHSEYYVFTELSVKKLRFGGNSKDKQISFMEQKRLLLKKWTKSNTKTKTSKYWKEPAKILKKVRPRKLTAPDLSS